MYDKTCIPHEKTKLYKKIVPENTREYLLKENDMGFKCLTFSRKDFPFRKIDGTEQNYYGWYVLIPVDKEILSFNENNGSPMNFDMLKLKHEDGSDLIIKKDNVEYQVYGKFNIAKTSNNWSIKIMIL